MPWYNGDYPPSYKNQPKYMREKAVEIANEVLKSTHNEGEASRLKGLTSKIFRKPLSDQLQAKQ